MSNSHTITRKAIQVAIDELCAKKVHCMTILFKKMIILNDFIIFYFCFLKLQNKKLKHY